MPAFLNFICYSRSDAAFALKLANNLKQSSIPVWIDKLDIGIGERWDREIEKALNKADCIIVLLSGSAIQSENVMDEISFAFDENKKIIPLKITPCSIPLRLRRIQHIDFTEDYNTGLNQLLQLLEPVKEITGQKQTGNKEITTEKLSDVKTNKPAKKSRSIFSNDHFLTKEEITQSVNKYTKEIVKKQLIIYKTKTQHTWLITTGKEVFCLLDDEEGRANNDLIQWRMPVKEAKVKIYARPHKRNSGLLDIGARKNWLYSTSLFPSPETLEQTIKELLS